MAKSKAPSEVVDINDPGNVFDLRPGNRKNLLKFCAFALLVAICFMGVIAVTAMIDSFAQVVSTRFIADPEP